MTDRFRLAAVVAIEIGIKGRVPTSMTEDEIYAEFAHLGIARETLENPAVFTVDDSAFVHRLLPGAHTKYTFLTANSGESWLVGFTSAIGRVSGWDRVLSYVAGAGGPGSIKKQKQDNTN